MRVSTLSKYWDIDFDNLSDALEGMASLALSHIKLKDDAERWYRVIPTPAK